MQDFYATNNVVDRLTSMIPTTIRQTNKAPLLRASAAQVRALVPCGQQLAERFLGNAPQHEAAKVAAARLNDCCKALARDAPAGWQERLAVSSRLFVALLVALEARSSNAKFWRVKPKLHLFLELCSSGSKPSLCWTYRDEDFGGSCARIAKRRGGLLNATATSKGMLTKFMIGQPMIRL